MTLDIIIPLYNSEKNILNYYNKINDELKNIKHNFIFIDNASTDKTMEVLNNIYQKDDLNVKIISLSKTCDKETTILSGLSNSNSDLTCIFDIDLQANVSYIIKMYEFLKEHPNYDSVCMYSNYQEKNIIKKFKNILINKLFGLNIDINKTSIRMMKKNVLNAILKISKKSFSFYTFELIGFETYYLKFDNKNHIDKIDYKKIIKYSEKPFNYIKIINIVLLIIFVVLLTLRLLNKIKIGNSTLFFSIFILSIIQIYIIRLISFIMNMKKKKTNYFIKEQIGFDDNIL